MKSLLIKSTSILLVILIALMVNSIIFTDPVFVPKANAVDLNGDQLLTGLGIAFVLYVLFESTDNDNLGGEEIKTPDFEDEQNYDISINSINLDLLARAIYAEARGESFEGQVAVGAVIVNRMESPKFPNTIEKVLYQPNQFKCVENGRINQTPNQNAYKAARRAIEGDDPSQGALFFFNPETSENPAAFDRYTVTVRIGNHIFAK
ncbi:MAG TPA: cell wall hydrolase [Halanaerobiales bacterium]|nr:cell wall hydrolase [Halanaerobiales bacterium]